MTDEAEQSIPSRGSHGEPVGWQATDEFGRPSGFLSWKDGETRWPKSATVPLYIRPQPTLTDEEREAIRMARSIMLVEHDLSVGEEFNGKQPRKSSGYWWGLSDGLRSLLERTKCTT